MMLTTVVGRGGVWGDPMRGKAQPGTTRHDGARGGLLSRRATLYSCPKRHTMHLHLYLLAS
ncbi:hypothetical protein [Nitrosomonas communis]|uniref:hypothetical protein n=1 Tax=Nitrosomonas communis TaxID=44574 RepID=UPI003D2DC228